MKIVKNNNQNLSSTRSELISIISFGFGLGLLIATSFLGTLIVYFQKLHFIQISKIFLQSAIIGLITTFVYNYLQKRYSFNTLASIFILAISAFYFFLFYKISFSASKDIYFQWSFIALFPIINTLFALFNGFNNSLFNIRDEKKLSSFSTIGLVISGITVAICTPYVLSQSLFSSSHLFFFASLCGVFSIFITWLVSIKHRTFNEIHFNAQYINFHNKFWKLIKNPYFRNLSLFTISFTICLWLINLLFLYVVEESAKGAGIVKFVSYTFISLIILSFLFRWISNKKLVRQYGIKVSLLVIPILAILLFGVAFVVGFFFGFEKDSISFIRFFIIVIAGSVLINAFKIGLQNSLFKLYFSPVESSLRFNLQNAMDGLVKSIATIGTAVLLIGIQLLDNSAEFRSYFQNTDKPLMPMLLMAGIALSSIFSIVAIFRMYKIYKKLLEDNLGQQRNLVKHEHSLTESFLVQMEKSITESDYLHAIYKLNLLEILDPVLFRKKIVELADHGNEHIQEFALQHIKDLHLLEALPALQKVMSWKYFQSLKTAGLVKEVNLKLNEALFRLEQVKYVDQLTSSKLRNERIYGALLAQHLDASEKGPVLNKLFSDNHFDVLFNAVVASANTNDTTLHNHIISQLKKPSYSNASVSAISASEDSFLKMLETAFYLSKQGQRTQQRILQIYGRIGSESAVTLLLNKLNYPNQNVVATCLDSLSRCGFTVHDNSKALQVRSELEEVCNALAWNMSVYLDAENHQSSELLISALEYEIVMNYETLFRLLALIYDPKSVELVKVNINSKDVEESEFASDLLDIFISDEMKSFLIPIFKISSYRNKVEELMNIFPTEYMKKSEMLVNLIQRDYKWTNSWTKACALKDLSALKNFNSSEIMASHLVNPDPILRETAAQALYENFSEGFEALAARYQKQKEFYYAYETTEVIRTILSEGASQQLFLKFDVIAFMNKIQEFNNISGLVLSEIIKKVSVQHYSDGEVVFSNKIQEADIYFVFKGEALLQSITKNIIYREGEMIHNMGINKYDHPEVSIEAHSDCILLKIEKAEFHELLSFYEEIPKSMLQYYEQHENAKYTIPELV